MWNNITYRGLFCQPPSKLYADWAYRPFKARKTEDDCPHFPLNDKSKGFQPPRSNADLYRVLVFLSARHDQPQDKRFIGVDYEDLTRYVILPSLNHPMISSKASRLINEFLREIVSNGYAYSPEIEGVLVELLNEHGAALRKLYEVCCLKCCWDKWDKKWSDGEATESGSNNFKLNWMLHFCEESWWGKKLKVSGIEVKLSPNEYPTTQEGHWCKIPGTDPQKKLWSKHANLKMIFPDNKELTLDGGWDEYKANSGIGDDGMKYAMTVCQSKGLLLDKIARWLKEEKKMDGDHAWRSLLDLWSLTGDYE